MDESSDLPFVSEKFGDVMVSQYPVYPNSKFILVSALVIGFFIGYSTNAETSIFKDKIILI